MLKLFRNRKLSPAEQLREALHGYEVPTFPAIATRALTLLRDDETSMKTIAEALRLDPGLSLRILKQVNSAAFGLAAEVESVDRAVPLLGRAKLETLLLSVAVSQTVPAAGPAFATFWQTSALRASLARALAKRLHRETESESFTGGLLQDLAVPILAEAKTAEYAKVHEILTADPDRPLAEIEREVLGFDHAEVGCALARSWDLPEHLTQSIIDHHGSDEEPGALPAVRAVSEIRDGRADSDQPAFRAWCLAELAIPEDDLDPLIEAAAEEARDFAATLH